MMSKVGIDDLISMRGPEVVRELIAEAWSFDGRACPRRVHLADIESAALGRKRLAIDIMVSAVGDSYLLPKTISLRCTPITKKQKKPKLHLVREDDDVEEMASDDTSSNAGGNACPHCDNDDGYWEHKIQDPEMLIELTRIHSRQLRKTLQMLAARLCANAQFVETKSRQTLTSFLATPKARHLRCLNIANSSEAVDEAGKPFREKVLYYLGTLAKASRYYRAIGVAVPNPKTQEATAFLWSLKPIGDDYDQFAVTPEYKVGVTAMQATPGEAAEKLRIIAKDLTDHLINIYGEHRNLSLLGKLLVFHSVPRFRFDGEMLKRGWLEMLEIGDTGQGKTQQVDRLIRATEMGESVDGVSTTRTGLAYAFQKLNDSWFLVWGKYALNDGKLLFIDEAQKLKSADIDKIRKGRSDGLIAADGVRSGEHPTRTRLIMTCNPRHQGVVDDELFGIELLKQTFKDEDIRRFDFAIISSSSDDKADINERRDVTSLNKQLVSEELLKASIRWAWSRKPSDIVFEEEATKRVYAMAKTLTALYGEARDIPLLIESDVRHKVARIAVAIATLLHSTDEKHQQVLVTTEHVHEVGEFLSRIYNHPNCSLDLYAKIRRAEAVLSDAEYEEIWATFRESTVDGKTILNPEDLSNLLLAFVTHGGRIGRTDLAGELGKSPEWTSKVVRILKIQKLIRVNHGRSGGYRATPKFTKFLKLAISRRDLEA